MTDSFKLRFIDWHKEPRIYLINLSVIFVTFLLDTFMEVGSIGSQMFSFLQVVMITFLAISSSISKYNTLTILANNFWYVLFSSTFLVFWVLNIFVGIPIIHLVVYITFGNLLISFVSLSIFLIINIIVSKYIAKYFKGKINAWVF